MSGAWRDPEGGAEQYVTVDEAYEWPDRESYEAAVSQAIAASPSYQRDVAATEAYLEAVLAGEGERDLLGAPELRAWLALLVERVAEDPA